MNAIIPRRGIVIGTVGLVLIALILTACTSQAYSADSIMEAFPPVPSHGILVYPNTNPSTYSDAAITPDDSIIGVGMFIASSRPGSNSISNNEYSIIKISSGGRTSGISNQQLDINIPDNVASSPDGMIIVAGSLLRTSIVAELNTNGDILWQTALDGDVRQNNLLATPMGGAVISGRLSGDSVIQTRNVDQAAPIEGAFIAMLSSQGDILWATDGGFFYIYDMAVMSDGSVIIVGNNSDSGYCRITSCNAIARISPHGQRLWTRNLVDVNSNLVKLRNDADTGTRLAADKEDNIYLAAATSNRQFYSKLDANGDVLWTVDNQCIANGIIAGCAFTSVMTSDQGGIVAAGTIPHANPATNDMDNGLYVIRVNESGAILWQQSDQTAGMNYLVRSLMTASDGTITMVGALIQIVTNSSILSQAFIARLSPSGDL